MNTLIAFVVLLVIAIIFHELGHFLIAKIVGVRVEQFSLGFPPRLFGVKVGETDYCVSAVPMGGYVKLTGQDPGESLTGARHEFQSRSPWVKIAIVIGGPFANVVTAYVLLVLALVIGFPTISPILDTIEPGSPAEKAGLKTGDLLTSVNGISYAKLDDSNFKAKELAGKQIKIGILRDNQNMDILVTAPDKFEALDSLGFDYLLPALIGVVQPNSPAARAGLQQGDRVVSVDGKPTNDRWMNVSKAIQAAKGSPVVLGVKRGSQVLDVKVQPEPSYYPEDTGKDKRYVIGIVVQPYSKSGPVIRLKPTEALIQGGVELVDKIKLIFDGFYMVFAGVIPVKQALGGPQSIAVIAGQYSQLGLSHFLMFCAMINLSLWILNLLPIPVLDGGHVLFYVIELVRGKPVSRKVWDLATRAGMTLLLALMIFVIVNDFISSGILGRLFGIGR